MARKELKGLTIKIGGDTSDLHKSLDKVDKQSRSLSSELGQINKLLKLDPKNTELLAQKQKVLADAISNTESKLDTLKEAEKQVQAQFERGEVSEAQYRALQREIIETEGNLDKYKKAAKETADAVEDLGKETRTASEKIDDLAEEAEKAEKEIEEMDNVAGDLAKGALTAVAATAAAAVTAIVALAEESREYRTEIAKLETAFQDANFSTEAATRTYEALQSVLGETEQAVEAANHLAKLCTTEEELAEWTDIATGVYATFGASLPIEGLAEAANETMRAGQVTGPFADALNWAAAEGEKFGVTMKANTAANEEWNKKVEEAKTAEDYFNLALEECSNEQERQQLITKTLTRLYGSAAAQYKRTNAEVIRANQATEKWNKATAKIGKTVEPVVTDIKELGVTLLEDASEPLQDIADYVRNDVLPAIEKFSKWVKQNGPAIKAGLAGAAVALVALNVATLTNTIAQKGLKKAILATTVAQKALNLAQAATPWGLVATAVVGVTAAIIAFSAASKDAKEPLDVLTEEEHALAAAADEAAEAFRDQQKSTEEALSNTTAQMDYVSDLAAELQGLADASGKVQEKDQARANFILNELNKALGSEYSMVDGVIQKYNELTTSINEAIQAKKAQLLLESYEEQYIAALNGMGDAYDNMILKEKEYVAQQAVAKEAQLAASNAWAKYYNALNNGNFIAAQGFWYQANAAQEAFEQEQGILEGKRTAYREAAQIYSDQVTTVDNYQAAETAILQGNYNTAVDILQKKGGAYSAFSREVDEETARVLETLRQEAIDAGIHAENTRKNFENGVDGYTEEMVKEAEEAYADALGEFENAYADAYGVGEDLADGMTNGAENKRIDLLAKARSLVEGFLAAARQAADSHSPSRKAIAIFEDIGAGAEIGVENKTPDVKKAGTKQATALLDAYREQEINAQRSLRSIADQQVARQTAGQLSAATANSDILDAILQVLKDGQVLLLDGDAVVGGTAKKMDSRLGMLRILAERGAM